MNPHDRLPPHDAAAERALLGSILRTLEAGNTDLARAVEERIAGTQPFYDLRHREILKELLYLLNHNQATDIVGLVGRLRDEGKLEECGDVIYLTTLHDEGLDFNGPLYLDRVWSQYIARTALAEASRTAGEIYDKRDWDETLWVNMQNRLAAVQSLMNRGEVVNPRYLKRPADFQEAFVEQWNHHDPELVGAPLPFPFPFRIREGECTVITGDDGAGKSSFLGHICVHLASRAGWRSCIASMETPSHVTMWIMARQLLARKHLPSVDKEGGGRELNEEGMIWAQTALGFLERHLVLYDFAGITHWQDLLDAFRFAREKLGCQFFVVDSVMRIGIADDDYEQQGLASARFADFCVKTGAHVVLVIHQNKGEGRGKGRVRGSKLWTANAANVLEVVRNEKKADAIDAIDAEVRAGDRQPAEAEEAKGKIHDSKLMLYKQRFPGSRQNASVYLWFDLSSLQFRADPREKPLCYLGGEVHKRLQLLKKEP